MDFNVQKCKVMHLGKLNDSCSYYMGGIKLTEEEVEKDLGVWISSDFMSDEIQTPRSGLLCCVKLSCVLGNVYMHLIRLV